MNRAIFLDRDGVINFGQKDRVRKYILTPEEFELIPGVPESLNTMKDLGYLRILVTNQRAIARNYMTENTLKDTHWHMLSLLRDFGAGIDAIYYCPDEAGWRRKPNPGMILEAAMKHNIYLDQSYMVGDSPSDIEAGIHAGVKYTVGIGDKDWNKAKFYPTHVFDTLLSFAKMLKEEENGKI